MSPSNATETRRQRGRPPADQPRHNRLTVRLTALEWSTIVAQADGAPLADHLRRAALGRRAVGLVRVPAVNADAWVELARGAANLNQLAHAANAGFVVPAHDLIPVLEKLRDDVQALRRLLIGLGEELAT